VALCCGLGDRLANGSRRLSIRYGMPETAMQVRGGWNSRLTARPACKGRGCSIPSPTVGPTTCVGTCSVPNCWERPKCCAAMVVSRLVPCWKKPTNGAPVWKNRVKFTTTPAPSRLLRRRSIGEIWETWNIVNIRMITKPGKNFTQTVTPKTKG
jgi:hypothetical protein